MVDNKKNFYQNTNYIIKHIEDNIDNNCPKLKDKIYFEMTRKQIIDAFNIVLNKIRKWETYFRDGNLNAIIRDYKEVEGYTSELELCLAELDDIFHCDAISNNVYEIGKIIIEMK